MKLLRSRFLAAVAASLFLLSPLAGFAAEVNEGAIPANSKPPSADAGAAWDGTASRVLRADPSGILRTTEEYPYQLQNEAFIGASDTSGVAVTTGLKQIGLAWSVSPFGDRVLSIKRKTSGNVVDPCYLYLYGSDDNINFRQLIGSSAWVGAGQAASDTAKVVGYRLILPAGTTGNQSWLFYRLTLPSDIYPGRYLAIFAKRDSSASSTQTLSITYEGRWK